MDVIIIINGNIKDIKLKAIYFFCHHFTISKTMFNYDCLRLNLDHGVHFEYSNLKELLALKFLLNLYNKRWCVFNVILLEFFYSSYFNILLVVAITLVKDAIHIQKKYIFVRLLSRLNVYSLDLIFQTLIFFLLAN